MSFHILQNRSRGFTLIEVLLAMAIAVILMSAVLSAVIFNALIIVALIPLALRGIPYKPMPASKLLRDNLWIYGVGGIIAPFIGIKIIDMILVFLHLVK